MPDAYLYINDVPLDQPAHLVSRWDADAHHVIAVTFVGANGRCTHVSFDPQTGDPSIQVYHGA